MPGKVQTITANNPERVVSNSISESWYGSLGYPIFKFQITSPSLTNKELRFLPLAPITRIILLDSAQMLFVQSLPSNPADSFLPLRQLLITDRFPPSEYSHLLTCENRIKQSRSGWTSENAMLRQDTGFLLRMHKKAENVPIRSAKAVQSRPNFSRSSEKLQLKFSQNPVDFSSVILLKYNQTSTKKAVNGIGLWRKHGVTPKRLIKMFLIQVVEANVCSFPFGEYFSKKRCNTLRINAPYFIQKVLLHHIRMAIQVK